MKKWRWKAGVPFVAVSALIIGCADNPPNLRYFGDAALNYYEEAATEIDYAAVESHTVGEVMATEKPRAVNDRREDEIRDLTLEEAIQTALANNPIIRTNVPLATAGNRLLASPESLPSIYDPAIQESGVLFGGRGVEAALSAFDPRWNTSMFWGRDEQVQNNAFFSGGLTPGNTLTRETANFSTGLQKLFADGGSFAVTHDWNYQGVNVPGQLFPTSYTGSIGAQYRLPLLAGAGTEYTRIAGPIANSFGGITGVNQGVVIARINNDITLADFELSVRNLVRDVEDAYWNLYLQYRLYDTAVKTRNGTLEIWRQFKIIRELGGDLRTESSLTAEPQAREQYYETRALAATALGNVYRAEVELRRLMGLPSNDGQTLRPSDEPPLAEFVPDWDMSLVEALTSRTELRRQKFNIKSLELQLQAAHSLTRPRLDFVSGYRVNGFGDTLLDYDDDDGVTPQGLNSAYETLTQGNQTGWTLGLEMTMDLGFRSAHAQVRNIELRLAKARDILATQELDVSHEVAAAYQDMATNYAAAQANFNRFRASEERVETFRRRREIENPDLRLRAQLSLALAEAAFYTNLANYARSIAAFHFAKGDLLELNSVHLAESLWTPEAYNQALRRAIARSHAIENPLLVTEPAEFIYPDHEHHITVESAHPEAVGLPEIEPLPAELPSVDPEDGKTEEPPAPSPAVIPPQESALPVPTLPVPPVEAGNNNHSAGFRYRSPGQVQEHSPWPQKKTPSYESANLARIRARQAGETAEPLPKAVEGSKVGSLKPAARVEPAGFFEVPATREVGESLELDARRDLLQ